MKIEIPHSLKLEHEDLHEQLVQSSQTGDNVGKAVQTVADILYPRFEKEEEYALPRLGLLLALADGR
jgi:hypothetical protein